MRPSTQHVAPQARRGCMRNPRARRCKGLCITRASEVVNGARHSASRSIYQRGD